MITFEELNELLHGSEKVVVSFEAPQEHLFSKSPSTIVDAEGASKECDN